MPRTNKDTRRVVAEYYDDKAERRLSQKAQSCCSPPETQSPTLQIQSGTVSFGCGLPTRSADLKPGDLVLDLGSGTGPDVMAAARDVAPDGLVIGLDMSLSLTRRAHGIMRSAGLSNTAFIVAAMENLPLKEEVLHVVISNCVINLSPDKKRVFRELRRVLRPNGIASISDVVTDAPLPEAVRTDSEAWCACIGGTLPAEEYLRVIREAGFSEIDVVSKNLYAERAWDTDVRAYSLTLRAHGGS